MSTDPTTALLSDILASMRATSANLDVILGLQQATADLAAYTERLCILPPALTGGEIDLGPVAEWMPKEGEF